jgi:hypothetical protein
LKTERVDEIARRERRDTPSSFFHRLSFKNQNQIETTRNIILANFVGRRIIRKRTSPPKPLCVVAAVMVEVWLSIFGGFSLEFDLI